MTDLPAWMRGTGGSVQRKNNKIGCGISRVEGVRKTWDMRHQGRPWFLYGSGLFRLLVQNFRITKIFEARCWFCFSKKASKMPAMDTLAFLEFLLKRIVHPWQAIDSQTTSWSEENLFPCKHFDLYIIMIYPRFVHGVSTVYYRQFFQWQLCCIFNYWLPNHSSLLSNKIFNFFFSSVAMIVHGPYVFLKDF